MFVKSCSARLYSKRPKDRTDNQTDQQPPTHDCTGQTPSAWADTDTEASKRSRDRACDTDHQAGEYDSQARSEGQPG